MVEENPDADYVCFCFFNFLMLQCEVKGFGDGSIYPVSHHHLVHVGDLNSNGALGHLFHPSFQRGVGVSLRKSCHCHVRKSHYVLGAVRLGEYTRCPS